MKHIACLIFIIGAAFAFDKQAWIEPMAKYAHYNEKNELIMEADCDETPGERLVSKVFPEPTNTQIAQAISNGQDPTEFLDELCYRKQDPEVWKTLDNMVFSSKPCGVEVRMALFKAIENFGNARCNHGCNLQTIESSIQANWKPVQDFYDILNAVLNEKVSPWDERFTCQETTKTAMMAVRDAVKTGGCKPDALKTLQEVQIMFSDDPQDTRAAAYDTCNTLNRFKNDESKDDKFVLGFYRKWPQSAAGIAKEIMVHLLVVGAE